MASRKMRGGKGRNDSRDVKLSKFLSYVLRHGAEKEGLTMHTGGFVYVDEILALPQGREFNLSEVEHVVLTNEKKRFFMEEDPSSKRHWIRANQGHTVQVDSLDLTPITNADDFLTVVHGTYRKHWSAIKEQGLSRQKRTHIHFAAGEPGDDGVMSGMRGSCDVLIFINLEKALKDGLEFWLSANGVILCAGNSDGYITPQYFSQVLDRRTRRSLLES